MAKPELKFVGVELYFDDLPTARQFYTAKLGLAISEEQSGHFVKFEGERGFICLERKGSESYPSRDKAALFFEVADLAATVASLGREHFLQVEPGWAVLHDPEGHNLLFLQKGQSG
ncbi:MAG: VOC family protein [Candidatus Korobacteraceae bacterium]